MVVGENQCSLKLKKLFWSLPLCRSGVKDTFVMECVAPRFVRKLSLDPGGTSEKKKHRRQEKFDPK